MDAVESFQTMPNLKIIFLSIFDLRSMNKLNMHDSLNLLAHLFKIVMDYIDLKH